MVGGGGGILFSSVTCSAGYSLLLPSPQVNLLSLVFSFLPSVLPFSRAMVKFTSARSKEESGGWGVGETPGALKVGAKALPKITHLHALVKNTLQNVLGKNIVPILRNDKCSPKRARKCKFPPF